MSPYLYALAADTVFLVHIAVIFFNVAALVLIPLGAWRGWGFVRRFAWRVLHLALMGIVAAQAAIGRACFLTYWEAALAEGAGETGSTMPLVQRWLADLIYWPIPVWIFAVLYAGALIYSIALWRFVPPHRGRNREVP